MPTLTPPSLLARLWVYQSERFPLSKTVPLLAVFSAASITVSATLAGRSVPDIGSYLIGFCLVFLLFFQMRVCDEVKDLEDDRAYRPERPIPRGLVSLRLIVMIGLTTVPIALLLSVLNGHGLIWLLLLVWLWLLLMSVEFGVPKWLKANPLIYLLSHMAIMPLIDLLLTAIEWLPSGSAHSSLWVFIALSFSNGCVLEIGRKLWAPENERAGVDSYSRLWGRLRATWVWLAFVGLSLILLIFVGRATGTTYSLAAIGLIGATACCWAGLHYVKNPSAANEKRIDSFAGLWVFVCYASAGFIPLLVKAVS